LVVTPQTMFGALVSAQALIMALFGGVGVFWGPVIGAAVLVPLAETLHAELGSIIPGIQGVVYGIAIIVIILLAPEGIYWRIREWVARTAAPVESLRSEVPAAANVASVVPTVKPRASATAAEEPLLHLQGVRRTFGGLRAVDDVTLDIKGGT